MKIVRAMKERSRLEGEIKDLKHRMQGCLSVIEGDNYPESFMELYKLLSDRINKISQLKNAILVANIKHDMYKFIVQLGELKQYLVFLKDLSPKIGKHERSYGEALESYTSQISVKEKNEAIQATQKEINRITDLLDNFNAETDIGELEDVAITLPMIKSLIRSELTEI